MQALPEESQAALDTVRPLSAARKRATGAHLTY